MADRASAPPPGGPTSDPEDRPPSDPPSRLSPVRLLEAACPYLVARDGRWRSAGPTPEHRCTAVEPPASLALAKQRRLCLDERHRTCATYLAARGDLPGVETQGAPAAGGRLKRGGRASRWQYAATIPLVLDEGPRLGPLAGAGSRLGQAGLVVLVVAAFGILIVARQATGPGDTAAASLAPSPPPTPAASLVPSGIVATATPIERTPPATSSPTGSAPPSSPGPVSPTPGASVRTYRVQAGDTLSAIAARFGTTVKAIADLNGISDPSRIRVGQILRIP